jgi:hypothetical protein
MKALSLWGPWGSLMADGRKQIETRHWRPPAYLIGQELAIHQTMKIDKAMCASCGYDATTIPRGAVVCVVKLTTYAKFTQGFCDHIRRYPEGDYGDFSMGRFGWFCSLVQKFEMPIPATGHQGLWDWTQPL